MAFKRKKQFLLFFVLGIISLLVFIGVIVIAGFQDGMILITLPIIFFSISLILLNTLTKYYPLNNNSDYRFELKGSVFENKNAKTIVFSANEFKKGIWLIDLEGVFLIFDMRAFFFQKAYISSFFVRQLNFQVVNEKKLGILAIGSNLLISKRVFANNIFIEFNGLKKQKQVQIVKERKTKTIGLKQFLIFGNYPGIWFAVSTPYGRKNSQNHINVNEMQLAKNNYEINKKKNFSYKKEFEISDNNTIAEVNDKISNMS